MPVVTAPLVSAVLVFADARRAALVRKVVNQFIYQHYTPYELVIVNGTDTRVLNNDLMDTDAMRSAGCRVLEVHVPAGLNAATMKNHGLRIASGEWVICLDDDDYFHRDRLLYQMAHRRDGQACLLRYQLRVDLSEVLSNTDDTRLAPFQPLLHLLQLDDGIPCTAVFPRLRPDGNVWQFDERLNTGEYEELLTSMQAHGVGRVVCDNMHNPFVQGLHWPLLSIAIYHGGNELTREQFFPPGHAANRGVPVGLNMLDMDHLKVVLQFYNFSVQ
jgi:glycosyltransferase involved in cell wall biosynthesis